MAIRFQKINSFHCFVDNQNFAMFHKAFLLIYHVHECMTWSLFTNMYEFMYTLCNFLTQWLLSLTEKPEAIHSSMRILTMGLG